MLPMVTIQPSFLSIISGTTSRQDENACAQVAIEDRLHIGQGNVDGVVDDGLAGVLPGDALRTDIAPRHC